jgi:histone H3/H4
MPRKEKLKKPEKHSEKPEKDGLSAPMTKKYRAKPGKKALRDIKHQQRSTETLLKRTPMERIIREIAADPKTRFFPGQPAPRFAPDAIDALIIASEAKIIHFMRSISFISCQRKAKTITLQDVRTHKALNAIKPV